MWNLFHFSHNLGFELDTFRITKPQKADTKTAENKNTNKIEVWVSIIEQAIARLNTSNFNFEVPTLFHLKT